MSKYKPLDDPITRREACLILDRKRFDSAVRAGVITALGKLDMFDSVSPKGRYRTAPLLFDQRKVREVAAQMALTYRDESRRLRTLGQKVAQGGPPLTRRQINTMLGTQLTGILIRAGRLVPSGKLTDTQTAPHTFDRMHVAEVITQLSAESQEEALALAASSKVRVPR